MANMDEVKEAWYALHTAHNPGAHGGAAYREYLRRYEGTLDGKDPFKYPPLTFAAYKDSKKTVRQLLTGRK